MNQKSLTSEVYTVCFWLANAVLFSFFWAQLGIGFLLRERPAFAIATVATVVVKI